jgi:hypothetical protein
MRSPAAGARASKCPLFTRCFSAALIDQDHVEIENLDRSPIFVAMLPRVTGGREGKA